MAQLFKEEKIKFQEHLADLFKRKSSQLPISRRQLCSQIGISETYLSGIINKHMTKPKRDEDGNHVREPMPVLPNSYILFKMAEGLRVTPNELFPELKKFEGSGIYESNPYKEVADEADKNGISPELLQQALNMIISQKKMKEMI